MQMLFPFPRNALEFLQPIGIGFVPHVLTLAPVKGKVSAPGLIAIASPEGGAAWCECVTAKHPSIYQKEWLGRQACFIPHVCFRPVAPCIADFHGINLPGNCHHDAPWTVQGCCRRVDAAS